MLIILHPLAAFAGEFDAPPCIDGNIFMYRDKVYDFSEVLESDKIELPNPFKKPVVRVDGNLQIEVEYRYSLIKASPVQSSNWDDFTFDINIGQCPCPIKSIQT